MTIETLQFILAIIGVVIPILTVVIFIIRIEGKGASRDIQLKDLHARDDEQSKRIDSLESRISEFNNLYSKIDTNFKWLKESMDKIEQRFNEFASHMGRDINKKRK